MPKWAKYDRRNQTHEIKNDSRRSHHKTALVVLGVGLAVALGGDGYLMSRSSKLTDDLANTQNGTQTQISKLNEATTTLLDQEKQRLDTLAQQMKQDVKGVSDSARVGIRRARTEAQKSGEDLSTKIDGTTGSNRDRVDADSGHH